MGQRIVRFYRNMPPTKFHEFNGRVATALADKTRFPDTIWAANPKLLASYLATSAKYDAVYHESMLGSKLVIAERELLHAQLLINLDEIASILEVVAVRNPEILIASGFTLSKERRGRSSVKASAAALDAAHGGQGEGEGGA